MDFLAKSTNLGVLEILEVYIQYNGPRLLSCKNQAGKIFLALWVDEEEDSDLWLYMLISLNRLQSVRIGECSLNQAFSEPENGFLYEITFTYENSKWISRQTSVNELDEDCLPLKSAFLNCNPETLPQIDSQKIIQNAISKSREVVNLILEPLSQYPNEFPAFELGKVLSTFQPLVNQLGLSVTRDLEVIAREVAKKTEFSVFATSPGSFQIELASSFFEIDIFGNSFAGDAFEKFFELIKIGNNPKSLQAFMLLTDDKTPVKYRSFLEALIRSKTGLKIEWGSPTLNRGGSIEASFEELRETLEVIKKIESLQEKEYEIVGELFKVDKDSWKFGIRELQSGDTYKGSILEQAKSDAGTATISRLYSATILEVPEIFPATNSIKKNYKLVNLIPYESPNKQLTLID
jgi:hypothetical protein